MFKDTETDNLSDFSMIWSDLSPITMQATAEVGSNIAGCSQLFQSQLSSTLQCLKPPKTIKKKVDQTLKVLKREDVLSQL